MATFSRLPAVERVTVLDYRRENLDRARSRCRDAATFLRARDVIDVPPDEFLDRIELTLNTSEGVESAEVVIETIAEDLYPELAADETPQELLEERLQQGRTGIDAGAGIFEYDSEPEEVTRRRDEKVAAIRRPIDDQL